MNMLRTQEGAFVNLDNILQVVPQRFDFGESVVAYVLTAQPNFVKQINNETLDDCIQLCIYDSFEKLAFVVASFSEWLESSERKPFSFPNDVSPEEACAFAPLKMLYKDGIVYWKNDNGKVMKIRGSGSGRTRSFGKFGKPNLMPINLRGENNEAN